MSGADDRMRVLMAGYRRAIAPRASDRARVWTRLEDDSELAPEPIVRSPRRAVVIALACAIAAALLLIALRPTPQAPTATHDRDGSHSIYDASPDPRPEATSTVPSSPPPAQPDAAPVTTPADESAEPPIASPRRRVATPRSSIPAEDPLRGELRMIEAAVAALDRRDHDGALAMLREHGRRYPEGALVLEARSLRAITLCEAGRSMQGRGEARTLLQARSSSPYRARLREACELR